MSGKAIKAREAGGTGRRPIKVDGFFEALGFSHDTQSMNDSGPRIVVGDNLGNAAKARFEKEINLPVVLNFV